MLAIYAQSGMPVAWADFQPAPLSTSDMHLGPEGVGIGLTILVYWRDLLQAIQFILGFSWRDKLAQQDVNAVMVSRLSRALPWQHPFMFNTYAKAITRVQGGRLQGTNLTGPVDLVPGPILSPGGGNLQNVGAGSRPNKGPYSNFNVAFITVQFWRPPYAVRSDADILSAAGLQQEWLRYTSKEWEIDTQFLAREGMSFIASPGQRNGAFGPPFPTAFRGAIGQQVMKSRVIRRWYQIPEACLFLPAQDVTRQGRPNNHMYCRTTTVNPVTGYTRVGGSATPTDPTPAGGLSVLGGASGLPIGGCVNSPIGGGVRDNVESNRFFGAPMGTLAFIAARYQERPLQLPPYLMLIPGIAGNEALSQVQYDVELHFMLFDPERAPFIVNNTNTTAGGGRIGEAYRGHNCQPWPGDGAWYMWEGQLAVNGSAAQTLATTTAFQYADLSDLFQVL